MATLKKQQIEAEEKERNRIAKDLHDSLGQQLLAVKLYLNTLDSVSKGEKDSTYKKLISKSTTALDECIADLSNICFNLMPVTLKAFGLIHAIEDLIHKIKLSKKVNIELSVKGNIPALDATLETNIFRIIQEFVNNSIKHGNATRITINLEFRNKHKEVKMLLKDNGKGFDTKKIKKSGMGLKNVRSRVDFHNGKVAIKSGSRTGTAYEITIPLLNPQK